MREILITAVHTAIRRTIASEGADILFRAIPSNSTSVAYIRSGEYEQSSSAPRYQGIYGWIWTGRTTSGGPVYRLSFRSEALTSSSNQARGFGHAVRAKRSPVCFSSEFGTWVKRIDTET